MCVSLVLAIVVKKSPNVVNRIILVVYARDDRTFEYRLYPDEKTIPFVDAALDGVASPP